MACKCEMSASNYRRGKEPLTDVRFLYRLEDYLTLSFSSHGFLTSIYMKSRTTYFKKNIKIVVDL